MEEKEGENSTNFSFFWGKKKTPMLSTLANQLTFPISH